MNHRILFGASLGAASILALATTSRADEEAAPQETTISTETTAQPVPLTPNPSPPTTSTTSTTSADTESALRYGETAPPPDTVTLYRETRPNKKLLYPGVLLLGATYGATAGTVWLGDGRSSDDNLYIPVVGPWLNLADRQCNGCENERLNKALIIGSGVLQGAGAVMTVMSFVLPEKTEAVRIQAGPVDLHLAPTMTRGSAGLGAFGTF